MLRGDCEKDMTEQELDERMFEAVRNGAEDIYWTPEEFLEVAKLATKRKWGMKFVGLNHKVVVE